MWKANCECNPSQFVVYPEEAIEVAEMGILVEPDGEVTNRWADGVAGVSEELQKLAECEESAACPICGKEATWVK